MVSEEVGIVSSTESIAMKINIECNGEDLERAVNRCNDDAKEITRLTYLLDASEARTSKLREQMASMNASKLAHPDATKDVRYLVAALVSDTQPNPIGAIKAIRSLLGLPLKEAKELYEQAKANQGKSELHQ